MRTDGSLIGNLLSLGAAIAFALYGVINRLLVLGGLMIIRTLVRGSAKYYQRRFVRVHLTGR